MNCRFLLEASCQISTTRLQAVFKKFSTMVLKGIENKVMLNRAIQSVFSLNHDQIDQKVEMKPMKEVASKINPID